MYIFEINLKNSPSAPCHNKEGSVCVCVCVLGRWMGEEKGDRLRLSPL